MALGDMIPWRRRDELVRSRGENPFETLHKEIDRLFSDFMGGDSFGLMRREGFAPSINVGEDETAVTVTAELPGMDEKDIEVTLGKDSLTLCGEKKAETEEKGKGFYRMERSYGHFTRTIPLTSEIDPDNVEATFKKGVLSIKMPKTREAQQQRKKVRVKTD